MSIELIRNGLVLVVLILLGFFFLRKNQDQRYNWAIAFGALYVAVVLPFVNYLCIQLSFWYFKEASDTAIHLPFDLYFVWVFIWGVLPFVIFKGRYILIISIMLFWLDVLFMPLLADVGILYLGEHWLWGDLICVLLVFVPAYIWSKIFYEDKKLALRAFFQVFIMSLLFLLSLPYLLHVYGLIDSLSLKKAPFLSQFFLIIIFPALVAVNDLVHKGKGTPFPYDPTKSLVITGVYAYIRNPIQWSFTMMFIPLSIYFESYFLLLGILVSVAYAFGISDFQEYTDLEKRFGSSWINYKFSTPKWYFHWRVLNYPKGKVYFDAKCGQCNQLSQWFQKKGLSSLEIVDANTFTGNQILQVTYVDAFGRKYTSVRAIAHCFEHINLGYASLGWFMRFPGVSYVLQAIINTMQFRVDK